ncbi:MAG: hypothetical protein ACRCZ6_17760 [Kluyvera sp.]|jgi:hypothetical protein|uniref:hypothetical protein n=1 Tax=Kluyvera sp. TaxID=1538228 RepID=UPI003F35490E
MMIKQRGVALPLMLLFLALIALIVGRVSSLAGQQRGEAQMQLWREQANVMLYGIEDMVLRKLPLIDIPLFHRLRGEKENAALTFSLPLAQGSVVATIVSANQCLNLAPLWEDDPEEKQRTERILQQLLHQFHLNSVNRPSDVSPHYSAQPGVIAPQLQPWVCYLPGAGQHWDLHQLTPEHLPLLKALLPEESPETLKRWLVQGITPEIQRKINLSAGYEIITSESRYHWLELKLQQGDINMRSRDLIHITQRQGHIVRRRLLDDDAP